MRRIVLRRAGAGTRVYRELQPGQGRVRRAGDAGESRGDDDGQGYGYRKSAGQLKNMVASGFFFRKNKNVHQAGDNLFYKMRHGPFSLQGQLL